MSDIATFVSRDRCLGCYSTSLRLLSSGSFDEQPLHDFIANDPWGENPLPFLRGVRWEYVECADCSLTFQRRVLSPEWAERKFSRWISAAAIEEFERTHCSGQALFERGVHFTRHALQIEKATRALRNGQPVRVLDFGCGDGEFIEQCRLYGFHSVGVDRSTARMERSRGRIFPSIEALSGERFHAVALFEVLEHLEAPRPVLEALAPLLVPGGLLILETPDASGVTDIKTFRDYQMIHPLDHINGFTPATLRSFAERLGFEAIAPPVSHVTADVTRLLKTEAKRVLSFAAPRRTQQYFRKVSR
jgi:2-polyprenyl-3-methyl-5-hydroxy-6-metoxy-1,4-benzoquinol methylase